MKNKTFTDATFKEFAIVWNQQRQNVTTPALHQDITEWLEAAWKKGEKRLLLMAFRAAGKSTLVGLFCAWLLYRNPDLRILVLAADFTLAKKMVRNVKRIIERHPLTEHMKPDNADQWAADRFTVKRILELRDPSMLAKGVTSNITGSRADIIICDDVEVPNTCDTPEKRAALRERLAEMEYVLTIDGTQLYVGTPHHYYSIYADKPRRDIGEERAFLGGFKRLKIPVLTKKNESAWPERYSIKAIERIKHATGPNRFESQMMLRPVNIAEGRLDASLLQFYDGPLHYARELQTLFIGETKMVNAAGWWDPAFGRGTGDGSVCAVVFGDEKGNYYLHHIEYIRVDEHDNTDEATQQCRTVAGLAKRFHVPLLAIENNGLGKFLPNILRNEMTRAHTPCSVKEITSTRPKDIRILEGFDAVLAAQRLHVHESVRDTPFVMEMREWQPGKSRGRDDGLDAVAGALSLHPDRLKRHYGRGAYSWMKGTKPHVAESEFRV